MSKHKKPEIAYSGRGHSEWTRLDFELVDTSEKYDADAVKVTNDGVKIARSDVNELLRSSLNMQHIIVLAGSGTSLGDVGGPAMWKLWNHCVYKDPDADENALQLTAESLAVIQIIKFATPNGEDLKKADKNIEALLLRRF